MANDYGRYQLSIKINGNMLNCCADNLEEFKQRVKDCQEVAKMLEPEKEERPKESKMVDITSAGKKEAVSWDLPETSLEKSTCTHNDTREISGTGKYGPWKGMICNSCQSANFMRKDGTWKGFEPPKQR